MCSLFKQQVSNKKCEKSNTSRSMERKKVKYLRIFGSTTYANVSHQGRAKLDDRSVRYVFLDMTLVQKATSYTIQATTK